MPVKVVLDSTSGAKVIVTANVADFSADMLGPLNIEIITPMPTLFASRQTIMKAFSRPPQPFAHASGRQRSMPPIMQRASRAPAVLELPSG